MRASQLDAERMALETLRQMLLPLRPPKTPEVRRTQRLLIWVVVMALGVLVGAGVGVGLATDDFMWGLWGTMLTAIAGLALALLVGSVRAVVDMCRAPTRPEGS